MTNFGGFTFLIGFLLVALPQALLGQESRVWQDSTGKFSTEAQLVAVNDDSVQLKRSDNGKLITVPLEKLSQKDLEFLKQLDQTNEEVPEHETEASFSFGGGSDGTFVTVNLKLIGETAGNAIAIGKLRLDQAKIDGEALEVYEGIGDQHEELVSGFIPVKRGESVFMGESPENCVTFPLQFLYEGDLKKLDELSGSIRVITADHAEKITSRNLTAGRLKNLKLKNAGVSINTQFENNNLAFEVQQGLEKIQKIEILDENGNDITRSLGTGTMEMNGQVTLFFTFEGEIPDDLGVSFYLADGENSVEIPFSVTDAKIQ